MSGWWVSLIWVARSESSMGVVLNRKTTPFGEASERATKASERVIQTDPLPVSEVLSLGSGQP